MVLNKENEKIRGEFKLSQYVITDGKRYIYKKHTGEYVPTYSESLAETFTHKQAENICKNCLSKALRKVFYVDKHSSCKNFQPALKQTTQLDLEQTEKVMLSDNIQRWLNKLSDLNGLSKDALNRRNDLLRQLHKVEDEILDIEHWIEFTRFNGVQGYKASKELKECRVKRRSIKNELLVLEIILDQKLSETISDEVKRRVEGMDDRTYKPRIRVDLFDL